MARQQTGPIRLAKLSARAHEGAIRAAARITLAEGKRTTIQDALERGIELLERSLVKQQEAAGDR